MKTKETEQEKIQRGVYNKKNLLSEEEDSAQHMGYNITARRYGWPEITFKKYVANKKAYKKKAAEQISQIIFKHIEEAPFFRQAIKGASEEILQLVLERKI